MPSAPQYFISKHLIITLLLSLSYLPDSHAQDNGRVATQTEQTTTVYKVINPDGSVSFSDQPAARSETLEISPVPTVPALSPQQINNAYQEQPQASQPVAYYQNLNIVSPADQSSFNSGSGDVSVVLEISPALANGHEVELRLDNKVIKRGSQTQFMIPTVSRGTHSIHAKILSPSGKVLKEASSTFTLHRPSILR